VLVPSLYGPGNGIGMEEPMSDGSQAGSLKNADGSRPEHAVDQVAWAVQQETGERMLRWFTVGHLPRRLQEVSAVFARTAVAVVENVNAGPERTVALRKLLEAKDAAVRQALEDLGAL
jgi:hypothetical protein